jgi:gluconokinase
VGDRKATQLVVMGVSGTGKSAVGQQVAALLGTDLVEGDDHHPPENVAKMSAGTPLSDEDRLPWLRTLATLMQERRASGLTTVMTCSALRRRYRDILRGPAPSDRTVFLHLHGDLDLLRARMQGRQHFMPASLLQSQLDTLEELEPDEHGTTVDVAPPIEEVVRRIRDYLVEHGELAADHGPGDPAIDAAS